MSSYSCPRRLVAEAVGTGFLLAVIVGSGIMGSRIAGGNDALILLPHALATGGILFVMIKMLGPISGGHFNPAVTLAFMLRRETGITEGGMYMLAQVLGGAVGVLLTHLTFSVDPVVQMSATARDGWPLLLEEFLVTAGLVGVVLIAAPRGADAVAAGVGAYVALAIWSTSSTCFANPAVTIGRIFTDTVTGIAVGSAPGFVIAQLLGGAAVTFAVGWLLVTRSGES